MAKKSKLKKNKKNPQWKKTVKEARQKGQNREREAMLHNTISLCQSGRLEEAEKQFRHLLKQPGNSPVFLNQLGVLAHMLEHTTIGLELLHKSIKMHPSAPFYNNLGLVQEQSGDYKSAQSAYEKAIKNDPEFAQAHYNLGNVHLKLQNLQNAIKEYQLAIAAKKDYVQAYNNMANAQEQMGNLDEAESTTRQALQIDPENVEAIGTWCNIKLQKMAPEEIIQICHEDKALHIVQRKDMLFGVLGDQLTSRGDRKKAYDAYRQALQFPQAQVGKIYNKISMLKRFQPGDHVLDEMESLYRQTSDPQDKQFLCFALGKAYEDMKQYHTSFQYIAEGNRLVRSSYTYSVKEEAVFFAKLKSAFSADMPYLDREMGCLSRSPIFVVGMPRSGTTLVEQILASHSQVFGAGELHELDRVIRKTFRQEGIHKIPEGVNELPHHRLTSLGEEYVEMTRKLAPEAARIVDKMPHNFFWIGFIRLALPKAKIIHCKREPMDTCWSIFKNIFDIPHPYAQDLTELGEYYKIYLDLMHHWCRTFPGFLYEIEYEKLIRNQADETRELLEFCDLPWENNCLNFHESTRRVLTSSWAQVRKPLYTSSMNKWKSFEQELQPLFKAIYD